MPISHFQAIADILLGDAETLAHDYHEIVNGYFPAENARRRCAIAINAVGLAVDADRYRKALEVLSVRPRVEPHCDRCGSTEVVRDASAEWDSAAQQWVLVGVYDSTTCRSCEAESDSLCDWRPVAPETGQPSAATSASSGGPDADLA